MPKKKRLTVVNDHTEFLDLMREFLEEEGYDVTTIEKHQGAFEQLKKTLPDIIICDLVFGNETYGFALLDMLHLDPETQKIPTILCTAAIDKVREISASLSAKGIRWIEKPFTLEQLTTVLDDVKRQKKPV